MVLIGPNHSGKSRCLREIESWCTEERPPPTVVLDVVSAHFPDSIEAGEGLLAPFIDTPVGAPLATDGHYSVRGPVLHSDHDEHRDEIPEAAFRAAIDDRDELLLRKYFLRLHTIRLDGRLRFELSGPLSGGDLQKRPRNHLIALAQDDVARQRVRDSTVRAFGRHFVLNFLTVGSISVGMSLRSPEDPDEELALSSRAQAFHGDAADIAEMGDGVKAFTGLVAAVESLPHRVILIDEPEAFLHPPLARLLGTTLSDIAGRRPASLVVATHSGDFLMGCLESGVDTAVVRLGYENEIATATALSAKELAKLSRDPLMRSTDVLRALFHRGAVVTEADTDRAFYDEINYRLRNAGRGIADVLFLNAQNKHTIHRLVGPLRRMGIPAVAVVDLDVVKGTDPWDRLLDECHIPVADRESLGSDREYIEKLFDAMQEESDGYEKMKRFGLDALDSGDRHRAEALLAHLASFGLFVVPVGELESWLKPVGVRGKDNWLVRLFDRIGASPAESGYLHPGNDDVWVFIDGMERWVGDPNRSGMI
jgi:hypothetical protein